VLGVQEVDGEVQSLYREFQAEKEDLLDSIRLLGHQVLLKDAIIAAFIPQVSLPSGARVQECVLLLLCWAIGPALRVMACVWGCWLGHHSQTGHHKQLWQRVVIRSAVPG
jgi:hypothetical protein